MTRFVNDKRIGVIRLRTYRRVQKRLMALFLSLKRHLNERYTLTGVTVSRFHESQYADVVNTIEEREGEVRADADPCGKQLFI